MKPAPDELGITLDEAEQQRMVDEVRAAYRFNSQIFVEMKQGREALAVS